MTRRRYLLAAAATTGTALLGASLAAPRDSRAFYGLTTATAATWVVSARAAGPVPRGSTQLLAPVLTGAGAFGVFYVGALVARRIPPLRRALKAVLGYAGGSGPLVLAVTLGSGAAEEVFFRGALYDALPDGTKLQQSTAAYVLVTAATGNPALVAAAAGMGTLWGWQRRRSGGIQAPLLTHLTWSALMLHFLPPLFYDRQGEGQPAVDSPVTKSVRAASNLSTSAPST
ncbi:CPBP family intramembrane glutamic endopeptidase [Pseudonocardia sp. GCM10023141]|uniref:CPBP family intramembrane glutamic endopeptidase n=1 Tax=Pseudonocardia sp. GCM10023141 TaxID=3252653 RepID=UPI003608F915